MYVCGCVLHCYIYVYYIFIFIDIDLYYVLFIFIFACVCVCVCVFDRGLVGGQSLRTATFLTSELMDLDPHKLLTLVKRI